MLGRLTALRERWAGTLTVGVRAAVLSEDKQVFLVKHGYAYGWHFPGGGVERGETFVSALGRELEEEGNIALTGAPTLHGLYFYPRYSDRDHVALFVVRAFHADAPPRPNREIVDCRFFPLDGLPDETTEATRARLAEILSGQPAAERW